MIYIDASAIVAALLNEPEATKIMRIVETRPAMMTSGIAVYEASLAVTRVSDASPARAASIVQRYLERFGVGVVSVTESHGLAAVEAFARFGKPHHPAKLNMGDCFAYAVAKAHGGAILFVGDDFTHTDLPNALAGL